MQTKKRYQSASFLNSGAVFYGTLLFALARVFTLIQLFSDAATRKKLEQAPPENFTFLGILWLLIVIGIMGFALYLQVQDKQHKLRMKPGNYYLLLNTLFALWGTISAISYLVEMILFFEFVYLLDFLTLIGALVVPSVLYQLSDRKQDIPQDNLLFFTAIGSTVLSAIAALIVALVLRKSYTAFQLLRELMFRAGIILFGIAGLLKAIRLRAELPELVASMPKVEPKPAITPIFHSNPIFKEEQKKKKADSKGRIKCPDCGKKLPDGTKICPRCGFDIETPDLFGDDEDFDEELLPEQEAPEPEIPHESLETEQDAFEPEEVPTAPTRHELPKDLCPRCNKKKPPFLSTCPHCGYYPGDPIELAELDAEKKKLEEATRAEAAQDAASSAPKPEPKCEKCSKKIPGGLSTCPYCGYHPDDARLPKEPPKSEVENLFEDEAEPETIFCPRCEEEVLADTEVCPHCGYHFKAAQSTGRIRRPTQKIPRLPEPRRLTEKNSIECPECGRRYFAARDRCPYCGYGLYDD